MGGICAPLWVYGGGIVVFRMQTDVECKRIQTERSINLVFVSGATRPLVSRASQKYVAPGTNALNAVSRLMMMTDDR